jgi:L,D-transpeptidase ErfK/SrfK
MGRWLLLGLACAVAAPAVSADPVVRLVRVSATYTVSAKETLRSIGSRYGIDPSVLAADTVRSIREPLRVGERLTLAVAHIVPLMADEGVLTINIPQRMLFYRTPEGLVAIPVAVGSGGWQTPTGAFTIVEKELDPTWDVPASIAREAAAKGIRLPPRIDPGPDNPLGRHWLRLSVGGVGVHGTNAPSSIYQAVTHGCIRSHPDDIARLFSLVEVGTPGHLLYEPVLFAVEEGEVFLEVHRDIYRFGQADVLQTAKTLAAGQALDHLIDWDAAARVVAAREGVARPVGKR